MQRSASLLALGIGLLGCEREGTSSGNADVVGGRAEKAHPGVGYLARGATRNALAGHSCGATLIAPDVAVTAAHCIDLSDMAAFGFGVGESADHVIIPAKAVFIHPERTKLTLGVGQERFRHDVAILKLERSAGVEPLAIGKPVANQRAVYVGYGRVTTGRENVMEGFTGERKSADFMITKVDPTNVYATGVDGGNCWGDSGGPLIDAQSNSILGVLSDFDGVFDCQVGNRMIYTTLEGAKAFVDEAGACDAVPGFVGVLPRACRGGGVDETKLFRSGRYGTLSLAVDGTKLTGTLRAVTGSPAQVKCELGFMGKDDGTGAISVIVTDGTSRLTSPIVAGDKRVSFAVPKFPGPCTQIFDASLLSAGPDGITFVRQADLPNDVAGFQIVRAQTAFFSSEPNGPPRQAPPVHRGDTLEQLGESEGFARVRYTALTGQVTTGFIALSDLEF